MARGDRTIGRGSSDGSDRIVTGPDYTDLILSVVGMEPGKYTKVEVINRVIRRNDLSRTLEADLNVAYSELQDHGELLTYNIEGKERVVPKGFGPPTK